MHSAAFTLHPDTLLEPLPQHVTCTPTPRLPDLPSNLSVSSYEILKHLLFKVLSLSPTLKTLIFWAHWYKKLLELFVSK